MEDVATPTNTTSTPSSASGKVAKVAKAPSSSAFRERVDKALKALEPGKFLNLSTMRPVKNGKKELVYNVSFLLAARVEDKQLLDETVVAMGGSSSGGSPSQVEEQISGEVRPPDPASRRVGSRTIFEKRIFGTQAALDALDAPAPATQVVGVEEVAPVIGSPQAVDTPVVVKRPVIEIRPAVAPITKPASGFSFASKTPIKTAFTLAKPIATK